MRYGKEEMLSPWMWLRVKTMSDFVNYFILVGIHLIIIFFLLISTIQGPFIETTLYHMDDEAAQADLDIWSPYGEFMGDGTIHLEIPIWIVFVFMGSVSMFLGFLLKIPQLIKGMHSKLRFFTFTGLILTGVNMIGMILLFLFLFGGVYNANIYSLEPILLFVTICVSILYLIYDWIIIECGHKKPLNM